MSLVYVDLDLSGPSSSNTDLFYCRISPRLASFCCDFEKCEWRKRKAFIRFVHEKFRVQKRNMSILAKVCAFNDDAHIDYLWDYRIERLVREGLYLEHMMWTLSTYGGAVSAMADFVEEFADKALRVSLKQREIALRLNSPLLVSRCNMYIGLAVAQMGHYAQAFKILRLEYNRATVLQSEFLSNCVRGLWVKVAYMQEEALHSIAPTDGRQRICESLT